MSTKGVFGRTGPKPRPFWSQVAVIDDETSCWEWQGTRFSNGYGRTGNGQGAHRAVWNELMGVIPHGMQVMHSCDNPPCVRPSHLSLGSGAANLADMVAKGRSLRGTRNGAHKLSPELVREIRRALRNGESKASLARCYGVAESAIYSIATGRTWGWVE